MGKNGVMTGLSPNIDRNRPHEGVSPNIDGNRPHEGVRPDDDEMGKTQELLKRTS